MVLSEYTRELCRNHTSKLSTVSVLVLRGSFFFFFFPNYFQWQRGVFFVSHNLFSYDNDLNKLQNSKYMGPSCLVWVGCVCLSKDLKYGISILFDIFDKIIGLNPVLKLPGDVWKDMTWFKKNKRKSLQGCHCVAVKSLWAELGKNLLGKGQALWQWGFASL